MTGVTREIVRLPTHPGLQGLVAGVVGFREQSAAPLERRQPAGTLLPLVLSFGDPFEIVDVAAGEGVGTYGSFLSGFMSGPVATRSGRSHACVQVYLTPLGISRLVGVPGRAFAGRVMAVEDLIPELGRSFSEQLAEAGSWRGRFDLVQATLLARAGDPADPLVAWLWDRITRSGGQVRIRDLVAETGWSHRYVTTVFQRTVGLTPKSAAGVVRFERAAADLGRLPVAEVAARHGYADQSHLTRDTVRYAGEPPAALAASRRPTAHTALGTSPAGSRARGVPARA
ncbi:helix-turn-helix domain-containing protein [Nocardioides albus]|uniref:AraC-like DNA-binding protein n=1 Tax=Nocardioides albus TaxID=1841 RepID=A0A7W5A393_9ACTN|nr:AraC family transcriptional regulator [Nocardioides albus]MBB3088665.1 AraC-like DNA-binding protein [Nocardioides albus]GGU17724.1 AraC family transcriptional regulator [Nocardioides albus]